MTDQRLHGGDHRYASSTRIMISCYISRFQSSRCSVQKGGCVDMKRKDTHNKATELIPEPRGEGEGEPLVNSFINCVDNLKETF